MDYDVVFCCLKWSVVRIIVIILKWNWTWYAHKIIHDGMAPTVNYAETTQKFYEFQCPITLLMKIIDSVGVIFINSSYYLSNIGTRHINGTRSSCSNPNTLWWLSSCWVWAVLYLVRFQDVWFFRIFSLWRIQFMGSMTISISSLASGMF